MTKPVSDERYVLVPVDVTLSMMEAVASAPPKSRYAALLAAAPPPDDAVIERVARAICVAEEYDPDGPHPEDAADGRTDGFPLWMFYRAGATAAIAALCGGRVDG